MAGAGISGKDGDVKIVTTVNSSTVETQICEITKWNFNPKVNIISYASNKTAGYKRKLFGVQEATGTLEGVWDPANPASSSITAGTEVSLKLYVNATQFWAVTAMIESFSMDTDVDAGEFIKWNASYQANGTWTAPIAGTPLTLAEDGAPAFTPNGPLLSDDMTADEQLEAILKYQDERQVA